MSYTLQKDFFSGYVPRGTKNGQILPTNRQNISTYSPIVSTQRCLNIWKSAKKVVTLYLETRGYMKDTGAETEGALYKQHRRADPRQTPLDAVEPTTLWDAERSQPSDLWQAIGRGKQTCIMYLHKIINHLGLGDGRTEHQQT